MKIRSFTRARARKPWLLLVLSVCWSISTAEAQGRFTRTPTSTRTPRGYLTPTPTFTITATPEPVPPTAVITPNATASASRTFTATRTATATVNLLTPSATPRNTPTFPPGGAAITFRVAPQVAVGSSISALVTGHFNPPESGGDDFLDVVAGDAGNQTIRWLQGRGTGAFQIRSAIDAGGSCVAMTSADLDDDGLLDVACASANGDLAVLFGRGDGSFERPASLRVATSPRAVLAIGPVLLIADGGSSAVVVVRVAVDRSLSLAQSIALGGSPGALAAADVDGNGSIEIAVAGRSDGTVTLLQETETGDFAIGRVLAVSETPGVLALGDVNRDGRPDLVIGDRDADTLSVHLNGGDGLFTQVATIAAGRSPSVIAIVPDQESGERLNGDGLADLLVVNEGANDVMVLIGNGDGQFELLSRLTVGSQPAALAMGQLDNDDEGSLDLVVGSRGSGTISTLRGQGGGSFVAALAFSTAPEPAAVVSADFNGDTYPDVATLHPSAGLVSVLRGNGRGSLRDPQTYPAMSDPSTMTVGDYNHDGFPDVAVAGPGSDAVALLRGSRRGLTTPLTVNTGAINRRLVSGDVDLDGHSDLVALQPDLGRLTVHLGRPAGLASTGSNIDVGAPPVDAIVAKVAGDSHPDLIVLTSTPPQILVFEGQGGGRFAAPIVNGLREPGTDIVLDDVIPDGIPDIAVLTPTVNRIRVLRGDGSGHFDEALDLETPPQPVGLAAADLNGNGAADLLTLSADEDVLIVYSSTGSSFAVQRFAIGRTPVGLVLADLHLVSDPTGGLPELVTINSGASTVTVFRNITRAQAPEPTPTDTRQPRTPTPRQQATVPGRPGSSAAESSGGTCAVVATDPSGLTWLVILPLLWRRIRGRNE